MNATIVCLILFVLIPARADDRLLLARFELKEGGAEYGRAVKPLRVVALYRSALGAGPLAEFVEVEATQDNQTTKHRLSVGAAGRLLDIFESTKFPDIDYQKHFEELAKAAPEARRGIAWAGEGGGARRELIDIRTSHRVVRFDIWSPEICFYSHPSDRIAQLVFRIVEACSSAIGAETIFVSLPTEPNKALEPTAIAVTPAAAHPSRQQ